MTWLGDQLAETNLISAFVDLPGGTLESAVKCGSQAYLTSNRHMSGLYLVSNPKLVCKEPRIPSQLGTEALGLI